LKLNQTKGLKDLIQKDNLPCPNLIEVEILEGAKLD